MSVGGYTNTNTTILAMIQAYDGRETGVAPKYSDGNFYAEINDNSFSNIGVTNSNSQGFYIANKNNSGNNIGYKNGVKVINGANVSTGKTAINLYIGAENAGPIRRYSLFNVQFIFIGLGISDTEASAMYTSVQNYQTSMQRQV